MLQKPNRRRSRCSEILKNMKAFCIVLFAVLTMFVLTISAEDSKGREFEKKMIYWKRDVVDDPENEGLLEYFE